MTSPSDAPTFPCARTAADIAACAADAEWMAEQIAEARRLAAAPGFVRGRDIAKALVALVDHHSETVYCVMSVEDRECVSVWRSEQEAQDEAARLRREHGRWLFYVRANALQGAQ